MLGGIDHDERRQLLETVAHFVSRLNEERGRNAELSRKLEAYESRLRALDALHYGYVD